MYNKQLAEEKKYIKRLQEEDFSNFNKNLIKATLEKYETTYDYFNINSAKKACMAILNELEIYKPFKELYDKKFIIFHNNCGRHISKLIKVGDHYDYTTGFYYDPMLELSEYTIYSAFKRDDNYIHRQECDSRFILHPLTGHLSIPYSFRTFSYTYTNSYEREYNIQRNPEALNILYDYLLNNNLITFKEYKNIEFIKSQIKIYKKHVFKNKLKTIILYNEFLKNK